jgi:hypothetical protein
MPTPLYNPNDGLTGRDGGPYLDVVEMKDAERRRAEVEDREPDYDNLQPTAGVPLVRAETLATTANSTAIPSQAGRAPLAEVVNAVADNEDVGPKPLAEAPTADEIQAEVEKLDTEDGNNDPTAVGSPTPVFFGDTSPAANTKSEPAKKQPAKSDK